MAHAEICPVCCGNGLVPNGFYRQVSGEWTSGSAEPEICKSCNSKGFVEVSDESGKPEINVILLSGRRD